MYEGLKVKGRYLTFLGVKNQLVHFSTALRYSMQMISYDELRNYLAKVTSNTEDFVLPPREAIHSVMSGILSNGVVQLASNSNVEIVNIINKLRSNFGNDALSFMGNSPLIIGISNHLNTSLTTLRELVESKVGLIDAMDKMVLYKTDRLVQLHRDVSARASNLNTVWMTGIKMVAKPLDEMNLMFGSSLGGDIYDTTI